MRNNKLFLPLLLVPFLAGCNSFMMGRYEDADKYLTGTQIYEENVSKIDIDWLSGTVTLVEDSEITGVKVEEENDLIDLEKVHSYLNEGELKVKFMASGYYATNLDTSKKNLLLTYNPSLLTDMVISITSGKVISNKISATSAVKFSMTSGRIDVKSVISNDVSIAMTSGFINLEDISTNKFKGSMTSGSMDVSFSSLASGTINATSGTVAVKIPEAGATVKVKKTSGSVRIYPEHTTPEPNTYVFGDGSAEMNIRITSGTVLIR